MDAEAVADDILGDHPSSLQLGGKVHPSLTDPKDAVRGPLLWPTLLVVPASANMRKNNRIIKTQYVMVFQLL
jgi:hypothetical protein